MGYSSYSSVNRSVRASVEGYETKSVQEVFTERNIHPLMNPHSVIREARDSENHPLTVPIILLLDETGSMSRIPHHFVKEGMPTMMETIFQAGVEHPALLVGGIGDHIYDESPLQVGQFELGDQEIDQWLTRIHMEGKGGPNRGESYLLAWLFAANQTVTDAWEKREQKGFLFTIGDEPTLDSISVKHIRSITGQPVQTNMSAFDLLNAAAEKWHVYHLHIHETMSGQRQETINEWKQLLQDNCIVVESYKDLPKIIAQTIARQVIIDGKTKVKQIGTIVSESIDNIQPETKQQEDNSSFGEEIL